MDKEQEQVQLAMYREPPSGLVADVKVLADVSDGEWEGYRLEVLRVRRWPDPRPTWPSEGTIFHVRHKKGLPYRNWQLTDRRKV